MLLKLRSLAERYCLTRFKQYPVLGLELGTRELRFLELASSREGLVIPRMGAFPISTRDWPQQIAAWVQSQGLASYQLALSWPAQQIYKKRIAFPEGLRETELFAELELRLYQYFPELIDQAAYFDYQPLQTPEGHTELLLVATAKPALEAQLQGFAQTGLQIKIIEPDLDALARVALQGLASSELYRGLLDLRGTQASLLIVSRKGIAFQQQWSLSSPDLLAQIRRVWQSAQAQLSKMDLECLHVCGDYLGVEDLIQALMAELNLSVKLLDPFTQLNLKSDPQLTPHLRAYFALCCGLALRGLKHG